MKVSINWIREYLNFELPTTGELVERIGAQLGAVEEVIDVGAKYHGALVVKVIECSRLENSDHLNLCFIDDGGVAQDVSRREDGLVQVVCGAPNVVAGATVVWLPPGATVPSTYDSDPFVLESRELRGTISNGMLASPKELSIGDSHEGLLLIDQDIVPGTSFIEAFKLDDSIVDIENKMFTHRPDCFGQLGVAREVAGILGQQFMSPDWYVKPAIIPAGEGLPITVTNEIPDDVSRFMMISLKGVQVKPSPIWLQTQLNRVGIRPINNVVDITNYIMVLTGQPLHAYDYDKVRALSEGEAAAVAVRYPRENEQVTLLNGTVITPRSKAIVIATNTQPIGLGGVMGGGNTEVDQDTTNMILECGTFDMYSIRRTSMAHGLFTDAVTRYNKGQSPLQNPAIVAKAVELLQELANAQTASDVVDSNNVTAAQPAVTVSVEFVNQRLGLQLAASDMAQLLTNVEFAVEQDADAITVHAPFWRTDIEIPEDIVEEIGRLHGFDKLPLELPARDSAPAPQDAMLEQKTAIRSSLAKSGASEVLTYSFVHGNLLDKVGQPRDKAFKISNALSPDLQYYRFHALPSLLDKVHANIKAGHGELVLFELNKGHDNSLMDGDVPSEIEYLDLVYANKNELPGAAFYHARRYLTALARDFGVQLRFDPMGESIASPVVAAYDPARAAMVSIVNNGPLSSDKGVALGIVGEFKHSVRKSLKLPAYTAGFTIDRTVLLKATELLVPKYYELPRFPKVEQDICLRLSVSVAYGDLERAVHQALVEAKPEHSRLSVSLLDIYQSPNETQYKQVTFRVSLANYQRTLTDGDMATLLDMLVTKTSEAFKAERV